MCGCSQIDWSAFSWEAFATLATGISAVLAALWVGLRQSSITERQTEILDRQVKAAEATLKQDVFEKRFAIYSAAQTYITQITIFDGKPDIGVEREFYAAIDRSRFLFKPEVYEQLRDIQDTAVRLSAARNAEKTAVGGSKLEQAIDRQNEQLDKIQNWLLNLQQVFGSELNLSNESQ